MLTKLLGCGLLAVIVTGVGRADLAADDAYRKEVEAWRAERVSQLTDAHGWLTLIGLHFIEPGENTVGSAKDNAIVLAAGPEHLGAVTQDEKGKIRIRINPGVDAQVDGRSVLSAEMEPDRRGQPTVVTSGTVSFYLIIREGKMALRVKNTQAKRRTDFSGLDYYPIDPSWRIEARWVPFLKPRQVPMSNGAGQESTALVLGKVVFEKYGRTLELLPIQESLGEPLFFIISDETSGKETYEAARFVYADPPKDGVVVLDFNRAINPPCAFTPFATRPLLPAENRLPVPVTAGEKDYRGVRD